MSIPFHQVHAQGQYSRQQCRTLRPVIYKPSTYPTDQCHALLVVDISKFLPPMPQDVQAHMQQNMMMQQAMGQGQQQGMPNAVQPPPPPQGANEVMNAPNNRVMQRSRNQHRPQQGEM